MPNLVISSAQSGLLLWFNKILPSIFPFLIGTNILIYLGFIDFLGTLLEPFMKKFFNVPGCGAFALVLGMFSGYPVGAKITSSLREKDKISKYEAQRLISFTNNSGPLFVIGTVGIGMFQNIKIGYLMIIIHYLSAISTGFLFRFYKYNSDNKSNLSSPVSIKKAFLNLKLARIKENKSFGEILGNSVKNSLETITLIGGFVVLFSVISKILKVSNIFDIIGELLIPDKFSNLSNGLFMGLIEVTNGINILSSFNNKESIILASGLISFSGFSIHSQTASIINKSDIKMSIYILSKLIHSIFSILYGIILIPIIEKILNQETSLVFNSFNETTLKNSSLHFLSSIFILIILSITCIFLLKSKKK